MPREIIVPRRGPPEVFTEREVPSPQPGPLEVAVEVRAAGVNFADLMGRMGLYPEAPPIPFSPGFEVAGTVRALGAGVEGLLEGDPVMAVTRFGGYAEEVVADARMVFAIPDGVDMTTAAAFPVIHATADLALFAVGALKDGERVLIHTAAGGVGTAAVALAKRLDVTIIGTTSTKEKAAFLEQNGVDHAIAYRERDVAEAVKEFTDGEGVHLVLDPRGGRGLTESFDLLAPLGRIVAFGASEIAPGNKRSMLKAIWAMLKFPKIKATTLMMKNRGILGLNLLPLFGREDLARSFKDRLLPLLASGEAAPVIHGTHPLTAAGAAAAHQEIHDRKNVGKVVLVRD